MSQKPDLERLQAFFDADDIEWKPITVTKDRKKGLAAAYVTNRAIMDRLDEACGPENWRNEFQSGPDGGVLCGLSIRIDGEWITKWDGAENTDIEAVKGGLSSSMRRAAVQWGIGRYLYRMGAQWVPVDERGRFSQTPQLPPAFRPRSAGSEAPRRAGRHRPTSANTPARKQNGRSKPASDADQYFIGGRS